MASPGRLLDVVAAAKAVVVMVVASVTTEQAASALGIGYAVPQIMTGRLANAVAAAYLAARGRGWRRRAPRSAATP